MQQAASKGSRKIRNDRDCRGPGAGAFGSHPSGPDYGQSAARQLTGKATWTAARRIERTQIAKKSIEKHGALIPAPLSSATFGAAVIPSAGPLQAVPADFSRNCERFLLAAPARVTTALTFLFSPTISRGL